MSDFHLLKVLFLARGGISFNFGKSVFNLIMKNAGVFWERHALPFLSLIYQVLKSQDYNLIEEDEDFTSMQTILSQPFICWSPFISLVIKMRIRRLPIPSYSWPLSILSFQLFLNSITSLLKGRWFQIYLVNLNTFKTLSMILGMFITLDFFALHPLVT